MKGFRKRDLIREGYSVSYIKLTNGKVLLAIRSKNIMLRDYGQAVLNKKDTLWIPLPTGSKIKVKIKSIENIKS